MRVGKGIFVLLLLIAPLTGLTGQSSQAVPLAFKDFTIHQLTQNTFLKEGPMTAIDQEGTLLVAWQQLGEDNLFHWYDRVYKPLEKEWAPEEAIVSSPSAPTNFRIVGGEGGTFLALWQERDGLVRYSLRSEATGWSLPLDLPFGQGFTAPFHVLYHRYSQAFRLFWTVTDFNGLTLLMGKTLNKSGEWSEESLLYTSTQPLEDFKVSLDSEGHIYLVYSLKGPQESLVVFTTNRGGAFPEQPYRVDVTNGRNLYPTFAVDPQGEKLLFAWYNGTTNRYVYRALSYAGVQTQWGEVADLDHAHFHTPYYRSDATFLLDRFYYTYIGWDENLCVREYKDGTWGEPIRITKSGNLRESLIQSGFSFGLTLSWLDFTEPQGQVFVAFYERRGLFPVVSFTQKGEKGDSLFYHFQYNELQWKNSPFNIVDGKNRVSQFYLYRALNSEPFLFAEPPLKSFAITGGDSSGLQVVEPYTQFSFKDYALASSHTPGDYKYALVAVDADGNLSEPVVAQLLP